MNGFQRRTEQKKESIRNAAVELFQEYGFNKVSISDIAKKAHVSHVTLYKYFGGKDELVRDIIQRNVLDLTAKVKEILDSDMPYLEKVEALTSSKVTTAIGFQGELLSTIARDYPEMKRFMEKLRTDNTQLTENFLAEGKKSGYIRKDISTRSLKIFFNVFRNGIYADKQLLESIKVDEQLARDINHILLYGFIQKQE